MSRAEKMRIAFIAQPIDRMNPPVQEGSLAIWFYQIATRCAAQGHQMVVLANQGGTLRTGRRWHEGVEYVHTRTGPNRALNRISKSRRGKGQVPLFASSSRDAGYAIEAAIQCGRRNCDIVHVMNFSQFIPILRRVNPASKIVLHMQCEWLTQLDRRIVAKRLAAADLVIGCSNYITALIAEAFPEYADRCVTVPNAAPFVSETNRADLGGGPEVLFVGRVSSEKGIHDLIDAFHMVLRRIHTARLRIVGGFGSAPFEYLVGLSADPNVKALGRFYSDSRDGKDAYQAYLEQSAGCELGRRITFEGPVDYSRVAAHYRKANVLVNASLSESFGMSLVEAMMNEVPVVATRVGGMTEIVEHGETGLLVPPADPVLLAKAILDLLENPERAKEMGRAGRKRAIANYSWESATTVLLRQYESLLN